jgi:hypothetical protein
MFVCFGAIDVVARWPGRAAFPAAIGAAVEKAIKARRSQYIHPTFAVKQAMAAHKPPVVIDNGTGYATFYVLGREGVAKC